MADITVRKIADKSNIQIAELRVPITNADEVKNALKVLSAVRKRALDHLDVTGADDPDEESITVVGYCGTTEDGDSVSVTVRVATVDL